MSIAPRQTEQRVEEALNLVVVASHDLRGALGQLVGSATTLRRRWRDFPEGQRDAVLDTMLRQLDLLSRRLDNILAVARLDTPGEVTDIDILAAAEICAEEARLLYPARDIIVEGDPNLSPVRADPERLRRAITNVLDNALKYSPADTPVLLRAAREKGGAVILVRDWGVGIEPEDLDRLFQPFSRPVSAVRHVPGTGLGLFLARSFVEDMGGRIDVRSRPGAGSTFTIRLAIG